MNKPILLATLFLFVIGQAYGSTHKPVSEDLTGSELQFKFFKRSNKQTYHLLIKAGNAGADNSLNQVKIGAYYRFKNRQKLGISALVLNGHRRTNDWVKEDGSGWEWKETKNRYESLLEFNYSKKFSPLKKTPLSLEFKSNFLFNLGNSEQTIILKPGMSYFWVDGLVPKYSLHFAVPIYIPLNFETQAIYKTGIYLGGLYHFSQRYQYGVYFRYSSLDWTDSEDFKEKKSTDSYQVTETEQVLGLEIIFQL